MPARVRDQFESARADEPLRRERQTALLTALQWVVVVVVQQHLLSEAQYWYVGVVHQREKN